MENATVRPVRRVLAIAAAAVLAATASSALAEDEEPATADSGKIRMVIVVGGHGYNKKQFNAMFDAMKDLSYEIREAQPKGKAHLFDDPDHFAYDVIFLYNMNNKLTKTQGENFLKLLDKGVGLFVSHHAITGFQDWPQWTELIGARYFLKKETFQGKPADRSIWKDDVDLKMHIEDPDHPITRGLADYDICDETYGKCGFLPGNHLLISTEHKLSNKQIAWVRPQGKRKVFCFQGGHGPRAWKNPGFRHVLSQGIRWVAGRLEDADAKAKPGRKSGAK